MVIGVVHGFGSAQKTSTDPQAGVCCTECVQDPLKFMAIIVFVPLACFLVILAGLVTFLGKENVERGYYGYKEIQGQKPSMTEAMRKAYGESTAGKYIMAAACIIFVGLMLILFFTGPKGLAGPQLAPDNMQTMSACGGDYSWCVACKPHTVYLLGASAGGAVLAVIAGAALIYAGEYRKNRTGALDQSKTSQ